MYTTIRTGQNSSLALAIAQVILWGFNKYNRLLCELSRGAQQRFEKEQWQAIQQAARERIEYDDQRVKETAERLENEFQIDKLYESVWQQVKFQCVNLQIDHKQPECAGQDHQGGDSSTEGHRSSHSQIQVSTGQDTLEYSDVAFPKKRFAPALIDELKKLAPSIYVEKVEQIVIRHVHIERRMTPLNLYQQTAGPEDFRHAIHEYGIALKQLAAANIFPGDRLYKNFGVKRNKRVVFYDYDEIEYMTTCNFRRVPQPRNEEDEMAGTPWYTMGRHDVFPEKWTTFLLGNPKIRDAMMEMHPDIFTAEYWQT